MSGTQSNITHLMKEKKISTQMRKNNQEEDNTKMKQMLELSDKDLKTDIIQKYQQAIITVLNKWKIKNS